MQCKVQPNVVILWEMTGNAGVIVVVGMITSLGHSVLTKHAGRQFYSFLVGGKTNVVYKIQNAATTGQL